MECEAGTAEQVATEDQIGAVVDVSTIGRAAPSVDEPRVAQLAEVVGDQVLRLADPLHEFADAPVATAELGQQLPSQRLADQSQDRGWLGRMPHRSDNIKLG
jgi:hypothetical protein